MSCSSLVLQLYLQKWIKCLCMSAESCKLQENPTCSFREEILNAFSIIWKHKNNTGYLINPYTADTEFFYTGKGRSLRNHDFNTKYFLIQLNRRWFCCRIIAHTVHIRLIMTVMILTRIISGLITVKLGCVLMHVLMEAARNMHSNKRK